MGKIPDFAPVVVRESAKVENGQFSDAEDDNCGPFWVDPTTKGSRNPPAAPLKHKAIPGGADTGNPFWFCFSL